MDERVSYSRAQLDELSALARSVAEDIDDLYWKHAVPKNHEYMIVRVARRVERALILAIRGARHGRWGLSNIWSPRTAKDGKGAAYLAKPTPRKPKVRDPLLVALQNCRKGIKE